jgi:protein O-GlcNAc transferase
MDSPASPPQSPDLKTRMATAMQLHNAGRLADADAIYSAVLQIDPDYVDALHLSGLVASQHGDKQRALELIGKAIAIKPDAPMFHNNLGNILSETGQDDAALAAFERVLQIKPGFVPALSNLGNLHHRAGRLDEAQRRYTEALQIDSEFMPARLGLGNLLLELQRHDEAAAQFKTILAADPRWPEPRAGIAACFHEQGKLEAAQEQYHAVVSLQPDNSQWRFSLGNVQRELGDMPAAMENFRAAIAAAPDWVHGHYALACLHLHQGRLPEAVAGLQKAVALDDGYAEAHYNLGNAYRMQGALEKAQAEYERAGQLKPDFVAARWAACMARLPIIFESSEALLASRQAYREALEELSDGLQLETPQQIREAASAVGSIQPFYLAYQGMNDRELQSIYGEMVCRIQSAAYGGLVAQGARPRSPRAKLRIGFVSGFFHHHSNWKMPLKGWVEQLDRERFELYGYYTGQASSMDAVTEEARRVMHSFRTEPRFDNMLQAILDDQLDVLIYAEIGMDPMTVRLAGLRLAPVQCSSWGHPDTSGMPTIDYFLSSDLMEAPHADAHYSEKLVRLPNLSIHYTALQYPIPPAGGYQRADFGLDANKTVYFCAQSLFKYLPQDDDVFPRIAKQVPDCQFAFLDYPNSPWLTEIFRQRLARAFERHGLNSADHVVIVRHLSQAEYHGLNTVADIFLDSIGWSGCNSTLEAIACDLPIATTAGEMMRGRHTLSFMRMMGLDDLVTADRDGLIELAVQLGKDPAARRAMSQRIAANKHKLYGDRECIEGLADFLLEKGAGG